MSAVTLYDYPKSSAAYRVRIGLNLAGITYEALPVDLAAGAHLQDAHRARNPQGLVPVLEIEGARLTQSLAILNYLDATRDLGLLPKDPATRARAEALAMVIAVDLHPVCNLSVATRATGGTEPARSDWMRHFISRGLAAFEALLEGFEQAPFATGARVGLADICLIPQLYNADRWGVPLEDLPRITAIRHACEALPAFLAAHPERVGAGG